MSERPVSEELFETFCSTHGIVFRKLPIPSEDGIKVPDYELSLNGVRVLVEVKQFEANDEEKASAEQLERLGYGKAVGGVPGHRTRLKIQAASKQLKAASDGQCPTMIVLYNNVEINSLLDRPYEIKTAMFGLEQVTVAPHDDSVIVVDRSFGPRRKMTPTSNTSVSAVSTLLGDTPDDLRLVVYHNHHAVVELIPDLLRQPEVSHFKLGSKPDGQFTPWVKC